MSDKRFRDDDGKLDLGKIKRYEDSSYKVLLLLKYIEEQQDTIQSLNEENNKLKEINKDKEQDVLHLYKKNGQLQQKLKRYEDKEFEQTQMKGW